MLIWCLNQCKGFILKFSISVSFFSKNEYLNLHISILASFSSGGCIDEVVGNRTSCQGNMFISFGFTH